VRPFAPLETLSDIRRCYELRIVTESGAAALAAKNADDRDIAAIPHAWDELQRVVETQGVGATDDFVSSRGGAGIEKPVLHYDDDVHRRAGGVQHEPVAQPVALKTVQRQRLVQAEHMAVLDALRRKDPEGAAHAMRQHLENALDRMFGS
jgi:GntR family transcriptional repressor for pyruvate dehydrogenase complex